MIRPVLRLACCVVGLSVLAACLAADQSKGGYEVRWFDGFNLAQDLKEPVQLSTRDDIEQALTMPWYGSLVVAPDEGLAAEYMTVTSCAEYLAVSELRVRPADDPTAWVPFMGMALTCQAARLILSAEPAERSYLPEWMFNQTLPDILPPALTFTISSSSVERVEQATPDETWRDLSGIARYEPCDSREGEHCGIYYDDSAGRQQVQLVARGDFNADGIEDALISAHNSVEGGTYAATRMYVLTQRKADGEIELLRELEY